MNAPHEQKDFEEAVFKDYFLRSIEPKSDGQFGFGSSVIPKAEFCAKNAEGHYIRVEVSAMWHGWKLAKGIAE